MKIDHVTIAGPDLTSFERVLADLGMAPDYGGLHSNGITHMSLLRFPDNSYIEIMATLRRGERCPLWPGYVLSESGGAAWTVEVDDVTAEIGRVRALGVNAVGPESISRVRPDGTVGRWELGYLGEGQPGGTLPFVIHDFTPRQVRVGAPRSGFSPPRSWAGLQGLASVVLAVSDLDRGITLFRKSYGWSAPEFSGCRLGGQLAYFEGRPAILASSESPQDWIAAHLSIFGECPCAFLIGFGDTDVPVRYRPLIDQDELFGNPIFWLAHGWPGPAKIGFVRLSDSMEEGYERRMKTEQ